MKSSVINKTLLLLCLSVVVTLAPPDSSPPNLQNWLVNRTNGSTYCATCGYQFNVTAQDPDSGVSLVYFENNFGGSWDNQTISTSVGSVYYYNYGVLAVGSYQYRWWAFNGGTPSPAVNSTPIIPIYVQSPPDNTEPNIANFKVNVTTGSAYSSTQGYQFNATIIDAVSSVDDVFIEHNFTGTKTNYSVTTKNGNEYYYNYGTLGAGSYSYKWYANDTQANMNNSDPLKSYSITKATLSITLYINGTDGDRTLCNDSYANFTAKFDTGESFEITLWTNLTGTMTLEDTEAAPLEDIRELAPYDIAAGYHIIANWSGNQNYTMSEDSHYLEIEECLPPVPVIDYYGGNDPITIMIDDQVEPSATPTIYALLRNSTGSQQGGQPVDIQIYDKNRNLRASASMSEWLQGIYYYESLTLSANDNGTFVVRINTTTAGHNVTSIKSFFVRSFAIGGGGGGLDTNQNSTLYAIYGYSEQVNRTINESISPALDSIISSLAALPQGVWEYSTRTLTSFGSLVADVWGYGTRSLTTFGSLASDVWSVGTRTLTQDVGTSDLTDSEVWAYTTRTLTESAGLDSYQNATLFNISTAVWNNSVRTLTQSVDGATAEEIWEYIPRNLTYYEAGEGSNLTAEDVWTYATRELTQELSCENVTLEGYDSYICTTINDKTEICNAR